ncbi:thiolase domain-containing protein [uncultured Desulfuromusa sp.]|uniref:thiolase domain-containing protein n=1 Tax=uncultured Desulfuromusa sp. TaxID=219183 RepID=UPI002AA6AEF1|nr:thiolase domain-containing protein [uncultured Desulfuromusa sp.]
MRRVSIIGIGDTKMGKLPECSLKSLITEAGNEAILDAGIEKNIIEALFVGNFNSQALCGQGHMGALVSETLGLGHIPTLRVEGACASGSLAFRQALMAVAAGFYDVVLVGGVEKMTHQSTEVVTSAIASASAVELEASLGATFPSIFAMLANRYSYEYGDIREAMALCAVQNHENALLNPKAQMQKKITVEQVLNSFPIADPLTIYDCSLVTDGAAFVVICATNRDVGSAAKRKVDILGSGHAGDTLSIAAKRSLTTLDVTVNAACQAYSMAGIKPEKIDFAEVHDCFTITQILNIEDLGFFNKGQGAEAVAKGKTARTGKIPINTSGGLKAKGHPIGATGLSQICEVVAQLRGEAGTRQLDRSQIGLTHNIGGTAATCVVNIFRKGES